MPEDTQMTPEEIREMLVIAPVWDSILWDSIQNGDYALAESRFTDLLKGEFAPEEWSKVYWDGILSGIPSFRGEVEILSWSTSVLPALARAILKTATPKSLETIYQSLSLERARSFHSLMVASIPGVDLLKKKVWLQEQNLNLLKFFNTNLAGFSVEATSENLLCRQGFSRAQILPNYLLRVLFSAENAGVVGQIAEDAKLTEEQTRSLATVCGSVVLGLIKFSDLLSSVKEKCRIEETQGVLLQKALEEKILSPLRKDIEESYPPNPFSPSNNPGASTSTAVNLKPEVLPTTTTTPETEKKNPAFSPLPSTSTPTIPQTLAQQASEPFFKKWSETNSKESVPAAAQPTVGPAIIQEEMRAQSLSAAPKLGFRVSGNKLGEVDEKAAPLRAAELTMSNPSGMNGSSPSQPSGAKGEISRPMVPLSSLGAKLSMGGESFSPTKESPSGFLGKIKSTLSRDPKTSPTIPDLTPPAPPAPATPSFIPEIKPMAPAVVQVVPIEHKKEEAFSPAQTVPASPQREIAPVILPVPEVKKEIPPQTLTPITPVTPPPPPQRMPAPSVGVPAPKTPEASLSVEKKTTPSMAKIDLKKLSDITIKEVPSPQPEKQPSFISRLFGRKSPAGKITISPQTENTPSSLDTSPKKEMPATVKHPEAVTPPPPPAPPRAPELPKAVVENISQALPTQKMSPLTSFQKKPEIQPAPQTQAKTVETVSSAPRVVNYSEYPLRENPLTKPQ